MSTAAVQVRCYEELNDHLPAQWRKTTFRLPIAPGATVASVLAELGIPRAKVDLVLVNGESAGFDRALEGGERLVLYPVFEAIDIAPLARLPGRPLRVTRFLAGPGLEDLAVMLAAAGFDAVCTGDCGLAGVVRRCARERRILLTLDPGWSGAAGITHAIMVHARDPGDQVGEVLARIGGAG